MVIHPEVFLAAGYAVFMLGVALGLDIMAQRSHARSERYRTAGFTYHHAHDAWICPEEQVLVRSETDHERRLVRYRGRPQICNHCPAKSDCTDSDEGREVVRPMDPWPHSEAGRFHRGISLAVAWHLHSAFRSTPANFPVPQPVPPSRMPAKSLRMDYRKEGEAKR